MELINNTQKEKDDKLRIYIIITCLLLCMLITIYKWLILPNINNYFESRRSTLQRQINSNNKVVTPKQNKIQDKNNLQIENNIPSDNNLNKDINNQIKTNTQSVETLKENIQSESKSTLNNKINKTHIENQRIQDAENELL